MANLVALGSNLAENKNKKQHTASTALPFKEWYSPMFLSGSFPEPSDMMIVS